MKMTAQQARMSIVGYSFVATLLLVLFLLFARQIPMPFNYERGEHTRLLQIVLPTFFGYLVSAGHFVFNPEQGRDVPIGQGGLLLLIVLGGITTFTLIAAGALAAFYMYNLPNSAAGMSFEELSWYMAIAMGGVGVTVTVVSNMLFGAKTKATGEQG